MLNSLHYPLDMVERVWLVVKINKSTLPIDNIGKYCQGTVITHPGIVGAYAAEDNPVQHDAGPAQYGLYMLPVFGVIADYQQVFAIDHGTRDVDVVGGR